jgi:hypothetical protein
MGLQKGDLQHLLYDIFEIDSYRSKMGDDKDIIVCSFTVKDKQPAEDLMNFVEKGYEFVLDSAVSPGELDDGMYRVFVEMRRDKNAPERILEMVYGIGELAGIDEFKFRYYKSFKSRKVNMETLESLPLDADSYYNVVSETNLDNYKNFFNNSYVESIEMLGDILTIKKPYADSVSFELSDFVDYKDLTTVVTESMDVNAYPEILFLTKYIGDYNISKYGDKLVFENKGNALILKRI